MAITLSFYIFSYITVDWPSLLSKRVFSLLGLDEIIKLSVADDGAWLQVPPNYCFPNNFHMLSCNIINPTETYRVHLKVSFLGSALNICKVTAPKQE